MEKKILPQHDDTTLTQLEFQKIIEQIQSHLSTPYGILKLDYLKPSCHKGIVEERLTEVHQMVHLLESQNKVPLRGFTDIQPALEKVKPHNAFLDSTQIIGIKENLILFKEFSQFFKTHKKDCEGLYVYARGIHNHNKVISEIEETIDNSGEIMDSAGTELRQIRKQIRSLEGEQKKMLQSAIKRYAEFSQDEIITLRDGRMVLGIQQNYANKVNGIVHGTSGSGATVFVEPMETLQLGNQIQNLKIQERTEIIKILKFLTDLIRQIRDDVLFGIENIGILDLIHAKALLASKLMANVPRITTNPKLKLIQARHPLLILKMGHQNAIPLSIDIGEKFKTLIITGPNAGGKTVAIKTIGLLTLLVQIGMPVPAEPDSEIPLFSNVLVDIGDRQSLEQDLSTFSAHVVRLRNIIQKADANSLVLLDEIGTSTDPKEGAALAISILRDLTRNKVLTVATTHHGELKAFAHSERQVENASMEFDLETLQPTYHLKLGIPGSSYGFEIARRYGLPEKIIQDAQTIVGVEKDKLEDLIINLATKIQEIERERRELSIKLSETEGLRNLYERQAQHFKQNKKEMIQDAANEAKKIIRESKKLVEHVVEEIRSQQATKDSIKIARTTLEEKANTLEKMLGSEKDDLVNSEILKSGDIVSIQSLQEEGEVIEVSDDQQKVKVLVNNVKMTLGRTGLKKLVKNIIQDKQHRGIKTHFSDSIKMRLKPELDLRGLDSENAIEKTDRYLSEILDSDWDEVRIIHGKGTGVLRKRINEFLSRDSRVLEKRLGVWGEGDTGVTIVKLKK
jgi:DNA mismatch repair protein MutS2